MTTPSKFTSKPAACEAVPFDPAVGHPAVRCTYQGYVPSSSIYAITTRQGTSGIDPGDYIITEPDGAGFYPCKPEIFQKRWEEEVVPSSDDLEALGFEFSDADTMHLHCGIHKTGPQVVVSLHGNSRRDDFMTAKSLSLFWTVSYHPTKVSGTFGIRDNPTLGQIKALVAALKGE